MDKLTIAIIIAIIILVICVIGAIAFFATRAKRDYVYYFIYRVDMIIPGPDTFVTFVTPNVKIGEGSILSMWKPGAPTHKQADMDTIPTTSSVELSRAVPISSSVDTEKRYLYAKRVRPNEWNLAEVATQDITQFNPTGISTWISLGSNKTIASNFYLQKRLVDKNDTVSRNIFAPVNLSNGVSIHKPKGEQIKFVNVKYPSVSLLTVSMQTSTRPLSGGYLSVIYNMQSYAVIPLDQTHMLLFHITDIKIDPVTGEYKGFKQVSTNGTDIVLHFEKIQTSDEYIWKPSAE